MTTLPMKPSEALLATRDVLLTRNWTRGTFRDKTTGAVCARGALAKALGLDFIDYEHEGNITLIESYMEPLIRERHPYCDVFFAGILPEWQYDDYPLVVTWNDHLARDVNEVLDVLFDAAIAAKEIGQ